MRIQLSDERQEMLEMVRQSAKDFAEKNIRPHVWNGMRVNIFQYLYLKKWAH